MKTKSRNKMKNTTLKMMMIAITGLFLASLNNVAHAAEWEYFDEVNKCTGWDRTSRTGNLVVKNNCGFGIAVWACDKRRWDCGSDSDSLLYPSYRRHFSQLSHVKPYGTAAFAIGQRHGFRYVACGANGVRVTAWGLRKHPSVNYLSCATYVY